MFRTKFNYAFLYVFKFAISTYFENTFFRQKNKNKINKMNRKRRRKRK